MSDKPEALRLADALEGTPDCDCAAWSSNECACDAAWPDHYIKPAAAELRRLNTENEALRVALEKETAARREAQIQLAAAYEARNRAGIEFRRLAAKENAELVEALNSLLNDVGRANSMLGAVKARAALAKAGEGR